MPSETRGLQTLINSAHPWYHDSSVLVSMKGIKLKKQGGGVATVLP